VQVTMTAGMGARQSQSIVEHDRLSYSIYGERAFINSAAIHYFRMPRAEWRDVLVKAKLAGMNCIDTYVAWNVHEPEEGQWRFEGDCDLGAFLDLCAELELWVIVRPGPYICAEWDFGGFPWWLNTRKDVKLRTFDRTFLTYVDRYLDRVMPIIRKRQVGEGGSVILVQVENEYGYLAEDDAARDYMLYLRDGLTARGIVVPLITCAGGAEGTIEGANFWSNADQHYVELLRKQPDAPKIVTEFWTGWFEHWGGSSATHKTAALYEKRMMEALRAGFSGISHYMFFGGTNFGGYGGRTLGGSDIFMVTSYDYDAPLDEYGRITDKYRTAKRAAYFIQAAGAVLLDAAELDASAVRLLPGFRARGRGGKNGTIWFVESAKEEREHTAMTVAGGRTIRLTVNPGAIMPVIDRLLILPGVRLTCGAYVLCNEALDGVHTVIVAAEHGQRSYLEIEASKSVTSDHDGVRSQELLDGGKRLTLDLCHFREAETIRLVADGKPVRIIAIDYETADRSWRLTEGASVRWAIGYAELNLLPDGGLEAALQEGGERTLHFGAWRKRPDAYEATPPYVHLQAPQLAGWRSEAIRLTAVGEREAEQAKPFSEFGQPFGHLLYECDFIAGSERETVLVIPELQDTARVYVNGKEQALVRKVGAAAVKLTVEPNAPNRLQLLVQHMGRLNFSPYLGEAKGVSGTVYPDGQCHDLRDDWRLGGARLHLGEVNDAEQGSIIRRSFAVEGCDRAILAGAVGGKLKINGHDAADLGYLEWFEHATIDISPYIRSGVNDIEMTYVKSPIGRLELLAYDSAKGLAGWRIASGDTLYQALSHESPIQGQPAKHSASFARPTLPAGVHARLKVRLTGMSKGSAWLNGRELGRYWQIGPQEDYNLPMSWLADENELVLFDEHGSNPERVRLLYDRESYRQWVTLHEGG